MLAHAMRRKDAPLQRFCVITALPCVMCNRQRISIVPLFSVPAWWRISCFNALFSCRNFLSFREDTGMEIALTISNAVLRNSMDVICQSFTSREKEA